jgi:putative Mg2+ transporter-C (MgtC) family protein
MVFVDGAMLELLVRLAVSAILGAVVGFEREVTHKPAGLRTHMLVSLGAALFTILSVEYFQLDPARVAAGIVTGIGFIGAGSIIATRGRIHGVTTAASLWAVAAIGLAAGLGAYLIAVVATIFVFLILQVKRVEKNIVKKIK